MMSIFWLLSSRAASVGGSASIDGGFRSLTAYHVNPHHLGAIPVDMDIADLRGDIFFDLTGRTRPLACHNGSSSTMSHHDCTNAEETAPDVVVSKLTMHVREGSFGPYAACNVCPSSGIDDYSHLPCEPDAYICTCRDGGNGTWPWKLTRCDNHTRVGRQDVAQYFASWPPCSWDTWVHAPYACWWLPLVNVTGGTWYSTTRGGWCDGPDADPATCTWRATVDKVVNKTCANDVVHTAVEAFDAEHDRCFTRCPGGATGTARNTSSPCWVYCLFATLVGPQAMLPGGEPSAASSTARGAGVTMPLEQLENAFTHVFAHESEGGCPPLAPAAAASSVASVHSRPRASRAARALRREPWMWEP